MITPTLSDDAYAEIAAECGGLAVSVGLKDADRALHGPIEVSLHEVGPEERQRLRHNGMFTYIGYSMVVQTDGGEWWSTPDGGSVLLSRKRVKAILEGTDDGMPKDTSHLAFKQWIECHEPIEPDAEDDWVEWCTREHIVIDGKPGHVGPAACGAPIPRDGYQVEISEGFGVPMDFLDRACNLDSGHEGEHRSRSSWQLGQEMATDFLASLQGVAEHITTKESHMTEQPVQFPIENIETEGLIKYDVPIDIAVDGSEPIQPLPCYQEDGQTVHRGGCGECWPDGTSRVRIDDDEAPEDPRKALDQALPVKDLADGVERVLGFLEVLRDTSLGHKKVAEMFPFTSETSVRRWRKANGVVLA